MYSIAGEIQFLSVQYFTRHRIVIVESSHFLKWKPKFCFLMDKYIKYKSFDRILRYIKQRLILNASQQFFEFNPWYC